MKIIDITAYDIVKPGIEFAIESSLPKNDGAVAELLPVMERNEGAVFWLEPKGGTVEQQEACICVNGEFYALNSKFEKAIFRNVRLTRDFKNHERLVDGKIKLVIPRRLFSEKLRTSRRNVFSMEKLEHKVVSFGIQVPSKDPELQRLEAVRPPDAKITAPEVVHPAPAQQIARQKRKKNHIDIQDTFDVIDKVLARRDTHDTVPPILHTPHSLFKMLYEAFEHEFPLALPPEAIEQILDGLRKSAATHSSPRPTTVN